MKNEFYKTAKKLIKKKKKKTIKKEDDEEEELPTLSQKLKTLYPLFMLKRSKDIK
jgi:hypothetical protein